MKKALITGITGQDGAYLSKFLLNKGYSVVGTSRTTKPDIWRLQKLAIDKKVTIELCDLMNADKVSDLVKSIKPDEIYNLAAQSSVNKSFTDPKTTIRENIISLLNILEAVRTVSKDKATDKNIRLYQASTSEMYGPQAKLPITEKSPLDPISPYGASKAACHLLAKSYRDTYGLFISSGILFNHESSFRSPDYFIRRLIRTAIAIAKGTDEYVYLGQADNKKDFGYAPDYVEAMWLMLQQKKPKDYVICSGKSISIRDITEYVLKHFKVDKKRVKINKKLFRSPNVTDMYGDNTLAKKELGWKNQPDFFKTLDLMIADEIKNEKKDK